MELSGSCHCGRVRFRLKSHHPYPFNLCYCSICRKTAGGGGYAINLSGDHATLEVEGEENVCVHRARVRDKENGTVRESHGDAVFLANAAARYGSGIRIGQSWFIHLHPLSTASCRFHQSERTCYWTRRHHGCWSTQDPRISNSQATPMSE